MSGARPIALSGFMAAGKSTVGARLAREAGLAFVDLDQELSAAFAAPPAEVFRRFGEDAFRDMETRLLRQALSRPGRVVALGGGTVEREANRRLLREKGSWVHLEVPAAELARRIEASGGARTRPLWGEPGAVRALFERRRALYAEAPWSVAADDPPGEVVRAIRRLPLPAGEVRGEAPSAPIVVPVRVPGAEYEVRIGRGLDADLSRLGAGLGRGPVALLTDWNVEALHGDAVEAVLAGAGREVVRVVLPAGETHKRIQPVLEAVDRLLDHGWQRRAPIFALGGGVLGDMAGLAAALTLRGVPFVQLPTTLLAMVDSSVGGKTGVNHRAGKNLVGAFHQPEAVLADLARLDTLPDRELRAGLAEAVKTGLLADAELVALLEDRADDVLAARPEVLAEVVARCVRAKADVVAQDAREDGVRAVLNLGHTLGHAVERAAGYGRLLHGEAVSIGLVAAARLSVLKLGAPASLEARIRSLLGALGLPTAAPALPESALLSGLLGDKKRVGDTLRWILLEGVGSPRIHPVPTDESAALMRVLADSGILGA